MKQILVTRPQQDFQRTADGLAGLGFLAVSAPMMVFCELEFLMPKLDEVAALVFTSANGIRAIVDVAEFKALPCYVVGKQTAKLAALHGFEVLGQGAGDVASLVEVIARDYLVRGLENKLLHISGVDQAGDLAKSLAELSIDCERLRAYEMKPTKQIMPEIEQKLCAGEIDAILFYSTRSAKIFIDLIEEMRHLAKISSLPIFCLSKNIAERACKPYLKQIYYIDQPDEQALLDLLHKKLN
ncbi:MAG: hypothetical protein COB24_09790 [Hyphomicrobiales bacterium]|nr:MAG: hypothetical protein COB24_09790 [Hyphomicrobiales bacterium]